MLVICSGFFSGRAALVHRLIVKPQSTLTIEGKTNISGFTCAIRQYCGTDTLVLHEGGKSVRPVFVKGAVGLDVSAFDCGISMITADFRKTIRASEYPQIIIDFISFERAPTYGNGEERFNGVLKISLTGVTRLFEIPCVIGAQPDGSIHLTGERNLKFSDFRLIPPTHMLGSVQVQEELHVRFHLVLELDSSG